MGKRGLGLLSSLFAYTVWGIQPLYWGLFSGYPLMTILAYRILWAASLLFIVVSMKGDISRLRHLLRSRRSLVRVLICAVLIAANWLLNIFAAQSGQVVEASLGQYITPIFVICLGIFILKEPFRPLEVIALFLAVAGVAYLALQLGRVPLVAVFLVLSFAAYTFLKKRFGIDPLIGVTAETILLSPIAAAYLMYQGLLGGGVSGTGAAVAYTLLQTPIIPNLLLIVSTGAFTAVPLALFAFGVQQIDLSKIGFIQYYAPSLSLLIGVFLLGEPFTRAHQITFLCIWGAITLVIIQLFIHQSRSRRRVGLKRS